jgi:ferredoxin
MATINNRYSDNVPGKFYVNDDCIDCDLCQEIAPNNFCRNDDEGHSYICKQPENDEELTACQEALEACPVVAIGDDGDSTGIQEEHREISQLYS